MTQKPESTSCSKTDPRDRESRILIWVMAASLAISVVGSLLFLGQRFARFPFAWF